MTEDFPENPEFTREDYGEAFGDLVDEVQLQAFGKITKALEAQNLGPVLTKAFKQVLSEDFQAYMHAVSALRQEKGADFSLSDIEKRISPDNSWLYFVKQRVLSQPLNKERVDRILESIRPELEGKMRKARRKKHTQ